MQEKSTNKALLVYMAHHKQRSINDLTVTDKTDNRVTDLKNTQPYQRNDKHNMKISQKLTIFIHLFTFSARLSPQKPLKSLSCTEKNDSSTIFSYFRFICKASFYQNFVQQAIFTGFVHVKGTLGL
jgi:hypothetical protein